MTNITATALSGMNAAQTQLNVAAHNVANLNTEGFTRQQVSQTTQPDGGVASTVTSARTPGPALEADLVAQLQAKNAFLANLAVFKTQDTLAGALLNERS